MHILHIIYIFTCILYLWHYTISYFSYTLHFCISNVSPFSDVRKPTSPLRWRLLWRLTCVVPMQPRLWRFGLGLGQCPGCPTKSLGWIFRNLVITRRYENHIPSLISNVAETAVSFYVFTKWQYSSSVAVLLAVQSCVVFMECKQACLNMFGLVKQFRRPERFSNFQFAVGEWVTWIYLISI